MTGRTHALLGMASLWLLVPVPGLVTPGNAGALCAVAAFGALLPDLDASASTIRSLRVGRVRPFAPVGFVANRAWGHRTLLHSPAGLAAFGALCVPAGLLWGLPLALALFLGYASHLAGDACTRTGIPGWPNRPDRRMHLLPARLRFVTGSLAEDALLPLLALAVFLLVMTRLPVSGSLPLIP